MGDTLQHGLGHSLILQHIDEELIHPPEIPGGFKDLQGKVHGHIPGLLDFLNAFSHPFPAVIRQKVRERKGLHLSGAGKFLHGVEHPGEMVEPAGRIAHAPFVQIGPLGQAGIIGAVVGEMV